VAFAGASPRGTGYGVVLNSLTSSGFVAASLASLCAGGRMVEISKRDIWSTRRALQERADAGFSMVALDFLPPAAAGASLRRLAASLALGVHTGIGGAVHSLGHTRAAMRQMSKAQHVGKLVLRRSLPEAASGGGAALLVGGLGALGSLVCSWLWQQGGAAHVQLLGRSGRGGRALSRASPACLTALRCDTASSAEAVGAAAHASRGAPALGCVMYAGGTLRDGTLSNLTAGACFAVFGSKVHGSQAVYRALSGCAALRSQVAFSSVASLLGSAGQANYAAANAALDAWMRAQCAAGCVGVSVQWGAWAGGSGMAAEDSGTLGRLERMGMGALAPAQGLGVLEGVLRHGARCAGVLGGELPLVAASPFVWDRFLSGSRRSSPFFSEFASAASSAADAAQGGASPAAPAGALLAAGTLAEQRQFVAAQVSAVVRGLLGADVGDDEPLMDAGLDSLGAVELKNGLERSVGADLPATVVFDYPSVGALVGYIHAQLLSVHGAAAVAEVAPAPLDVTGSVASAALGVLAVAGRDALSGCGSIAEARDTCVGVPHSRWDRDGHSAVLGEVSPGFSAFVSSADMFDAPSFAVSDAEAVLMDPQQRVLLEATS